MSLTDALTVGNPLERIHNQDLLYHTEEYHALEKAAELLPFPLIDLHSLHHTDAIPLKFAIHL